MGTVKNIHIKTNKDFRKYWQKERGLITGTLAAFVLDSSVGRIKHLENNKTLTVFHVGTKKIKKMYSYSEINDILKIDEIKKGMKSQSKKIPWNDKLSRL